MPSDWARLEAGVESELESEPREPTEPTSAPSSAMLYGGRREEDHPVTSGFGGLDELADADEMDAIGRLTGSSAPAPDRERRD